jgi:hypothetical protein
MRAAGPAARPPHPFFKLRAHPLDVLPPCLIFLGRDGPTDPLVARERRYVFPCRPCYGVSRESTPEIAREVMYDSSGDSNSCHTVISVLAFARDLLRILLLCEVAMYIRCSELHAPPNSRQQSYDPSVCRAPAPTVAQKYEVAIGVPLGRSRQVKNE